MVSTSTLLLILAIWFIGYLVDLYLCRKKWHKSWLDSLVISGSSWGLFIFHYVIHYVYNTFFVNHNDNDNIND